MKNVTRGLLVALFTVSTLILSSCSFDSTGDDTSSESSSESVNLDQDTFGQLISIESENVSMASYDLASQTMIVVFDNGRRYWYRPVKPEVWTAFYNAQPHPWSQVGYPMLVTAGIPYGRLN